MEKEQIEKALHLLRRDLFAAAAMTRPTVASAETAYQWADAMLKASGVERINLPDGLAKAVLAFIDSQLIGPMPTYPWTLMRPPADSKC